MKAQISTEEMVGSLTGYDEIAIANVFGHEFTDLAQNRHSTFLRALVFVHLRREGQDDKAAKKAVMEMPLSEVSDYFADEDVESGEGEKPSD